MLTSVRHIAFLQTLSNSVKSHQSNMLRILWEEYYFFFKLIYVVFIIIYRVFLHQFNDCYYVRGMVVILPSMLMVKDDT